VEKEKNKREKKDQTRQPDNQTEERTVLSPSSSWVWSERRDEREREMSGMPATTYN
jgi:hypothetical protein